MTKIKLCGIFRDCDAEYMNEAMPDYTGFVFAESKRRVSKKKALELRQKLNSNIKTVGVFVNEAIEEIADIYESGAINIVQLHGDERADYIKALRKICNAPIIKAVRVKSSDDIKNTSQYAADYILYDTFSSESFGGTGKSFNHELCIESSGDFFLAGGLNIENVIQKIKDVHPYAVDISSGIETNSVKDKDKILKIVKIIREAS